MKIMKQILTILFCTFAISFTQAKTWTVMASGTTFSPANLTVSTNDVVHWVFEGTHNVISGTACTPDSKFNSGTKNNAETYDFTFVDAGTYPYYCSFHCSMGMTGVITVNQTAGIAENSSLSLLKSYPNPFTNATKVQYSLSKPSVVGVDIVNVAGQKIFTMETYKVSGDNSEQLDLSQLAKGFYIMQLSIDGMPTKELVLVKE
jgi:plastocyanin